MTGSTPGRWARLTWRAADPAATATALGHRLGLTAAALEYGAWRLNLGGEPLDVLPWRRDGTPDEPVPDGRLAFEPLDRVVPVPELVADTPLSLAAIVWATVDLGRAEAELDPWLLPANPASGDGVAPMDRLLGAVVRRRRTAALPGGLLLLAEPSTEGRLAASLARDGEGPCALLLAPSAGLRRWLANARARGVRVGPRRAGPLGHARLLPGPGVAGPHLIVVDPG